MDLLDIAYEHHLVQFGENGQCGVSSHSLWQYRFMAVLLDSILRLPPLKQLLARQQVKSRYPSYLISHLKV